MNRNFRKLQAVTIVLCAGVGGIYALVQGYGGGTTQAGQRTSDFLSHNFSHRQALQEGQVTVQVTATSTPQSQSQSSVEPDPSTAVQSPSPTTDLSFPSNTQASGNWAGYITTPSNGNNYTSVSGSWTVPSISGNQQGLGAQWIGLGGVSSEDLLQMGTIEQFDATGQAEADIFWEKLPDSAQNIMTVPIGSKIDASIAQAAASTWDITFTIHTPSGQTETKSVPVKLDSSYAAGIGTSAEWISEDPSDANNQLYPLANMGTVTYSDAKVDGQPLDANGNDVQPVALVSRSGSLMMAPSNLGSDGQSFTTQTLDANANGYGSQGYAHGGRGRRRHAVSGWGGVGNPLQTGSGYTDDASGGGYGWR